MTKSWMRAMNLALDGDNMMLMDNLGARILHEVRDLVMGVFGALLSAEMAIGD
jgi:hypothetical protein